MSRLSIVGATALSLALAVGTPTFAVGLRGVHGHGGGAMHVGSGPSRIHPRHVVPKPWFRGDQAIVGPVVPSADASYCARRWAYYNPASGKYMGDDGEWRPCR
jgi:BA14K-like protein